MAAAREAVGFLLHAPEMHLRARLRPELMVGVVVAEAYVVARRRPVVELRAVAQVADGGAIAVLQIDAVGHIAQIVEGAFVVGGEQRGAVVGVDGGEVRQQLRRELVAPVQCSVQVAPAEAVLVDIVVAQLAVVIALPCLAPVVLRRQRVLSVVDAQVHLRAAVEDVCQLCVQVVEVVGQRDVLLVVEVVGNGEGRPRQQIEPRAAQPNVERRSEVYAALLTLLLSLLFAFQLDGAVQLKAAVEQSDAIGTVQALPVAIVGAHVDDRRQPAAVACGETALVEVDVLHHVGVERREETHRVVNLIERCAVDEEEVLVVVAAMHVESRGHLDALLHTRQALQRLHHVGRRQQRELRLDVLLQQ